MVMAFDNHCLNLEASLLCQDVVPFAGVVYGCIQQIIWIFVDVDCEGLRGSGSSAWPAVRGWGRGLGQPASKQEMSQTGRMNTNYHDMSACSLGLDGETGR